MKCFVVPSVGADVFCNFNEPIKEFKKDKGLCVAAFLRKEGAREHIVHQVVLAGFWVEQGLLVKKNPNKLNTL